MESGNILLDGERAKEEAILKEGSTLSLIIRNYNEPDLDINYHKIFENNNILVASKPADLPISTNHRFFKQNLTALIRKDENLPNINPIHRLDRETSGLIIYLKKAFEAPKKIKKNPQLIIKEKYYLAIVFGEVEQEKFSVNIPLKDADCQPVSYKVVAANSLEGKEASTDFYRLAMTENRTLLLAKLNSGRKHQIRAHCAISGFPIIGDKLYLSDSKYFIKRSKDESLTTEDYEILGARHHLLHAYALTLDLPNEGEVQLKSDFFSSEFERYLKKFPNWQERVLKHISRNINLENS